jgi:small-conductance mechanosensitive channel/CRP-like cAMP-binding protein
MDSLSYLAGLVTHPLALAGMAIILGFAVTRFAFEGRPIGQFICHLAFFIGLTAMLFIAGVVPYEPTPSAVAKSRYLVVSIYKVIWWISVARLSGGFIRAFMTLETKPRETRLLQDLLAGLIYLGTIFAIVAYVFDLPVQTLIATSGAIAIILGLALQSTLGDVFSGIVLDLAKPYRPGDWVIFDNETQGTVVEMTWRATQIITASNDLATVPNSTIAKAKLINLGHPTKAHGLAVRVGIASTASPSTICAMLDAALLGSNRILHTPRPTVTVMALNAVSTECELYFFVPGNDATTDAKNEVFDLVHRHAAAAGLRLAPPPGSPVAMRAQPDVPGETPHGLLDRVSFFATLTDEERASLAAKLRRRSYPAGETLIEAGSAMETLIIIASGVLVASRKEGERDVELVRLGPGDFLGAASVLTGAVAAAKIIALTNAAVLELSKDDLAPVLKQRPSIATELSGNLVRREIAAHQRLEHHVDQAVPREDLAEWLVQRARALFHLS